MSFDFRNLSPKDHRALSSMGGLTTHIRHDSRDIAARARRGLAARFEREVDPDGTLDPEDRQARARRAMRLHMKRIARLPRRRR